MTACHCLPDKTRIARSFGRAAENYDRYARFQRDIADTLVARIDVTAATQILDLGSGTGYCAQRLAGRYPDAVITNLDIAETMLVHSRESIKQQGQHWVCSDAQALPFREGSFDLVVSSLTLQWCPAPEHVFNELYRVLKPGGHAWISTLAEQTLHELRSSWAQVDDYVHVNSFLSRAEIEAVLAKSPFARTIMDNRQQQYYYTSLEALARELKGIGANNLNAGQASGLTGKRKLQQLKSAFEKNHIAGKGIPVTYDLIFITVEK
jgi:malonyl-CoA O-methyltransferase